MDSCDQSNYPSKPPLNPYTHMAHVVVGCCGSKLCVRAAGTSQTCCQRSLFLNVKKPTKTVRKKWVCPSTPHRCFGSVHLQVSHTGSLIRKRMIFWKTSIRYQEKAGSYHTHFAVHPHLRSTLTQEDLQKFDETGSSYSSKQICSNGIPPKSVLNWDFPIFSYINIYYTPKSIFHGIFPYFPRRNCYSSPPLQTAQPRAASRAPGVFLHRRVANAQQTRAPAS